MCTLRLPRRKTGRYANRRRRARHTTTVRARQLLPDDDFDQTDHPIIDRLSVDTELYTKFATGTGDKVNTLDNRKVEILENSLI